MKLYSSVEAISLSGTHSFGRDNSHMVTTSLERIYAANNHFLALQIGLQEIVELVGARQGILLIRSQSDDNLSPLLIATAEAEQVNSAVEVGPLLDGLALSWSQPKVAPGPASPLCIPLKSFGQLVGAIHLDHVKDMVLAGQKRPVIEILARQLALILENSELLRKNNDKHHLAASLMIARQIVERLSVSLDKQQALVEFLESCRVLLAAESCFMLLIDGERETLRLFKIPAGDPAGVDLSAANWHSDLIHWVVNTNETALILNAQLDSRHHLALDAVIDLEIRQLMCVPLNGAEQRLGMVVAVNKSTGSFNQLDLDLLQLLAPGVAMTLENASRLAWQQAEAEQKAELYAVASHALRSPLMSILASVEWILETGMRNKTHRARLEDIRSQIFRLAKFASAILDMSRIEMDNMRLQLMPVAVVPLIKKAVAAFERRFPEHHFEIQMINTIPPVHADETQLAIILDHLLENAVKYSAASSAISVEIEAEAGQVLVSICDQGIGILPDELENIFGRYYRGRQQPAKDHSLGLGLYIVRKLVRAQGGDIWVDSTAGYGSKFTFTLHQVEIGI